MSKKEEQIEEMAKKMYTSVFCEPTCERCNYKKSCIRYRYAERLYNAGYRKVGEYKAEIERLNNEYTKAFERLKQQQQKIIVLERENAELYSFKRKLEDELIENGWAEYVDNKVIILSEAVEQARKETAKEIAEKLRNKYGKSCSEYYPELIELTSIELDELLKEYEVEE